MGPTTKGTIEDGPKGGERKPYSTPKLQTYGDLRNITQSIAAGPNPDGMGGAGMTKST